MMLNIALQISAYIVIAIMLGYLFGWLITKLHFEKVYKEKLTNTVINKDQSIIEASKLKEKLFQLLREHKQLKQEKQRLASMYKGQKYVLDEHNEVLDDFQKRLLKKDEVIEQLNTKLSLLEQRELALNKKYEEEIDAFVFERVEITQKYKDLIEKYKLIKNRNIPHKKSTSWI